MHVADVAARAATDGRVEDVLNVGRVGQRHRREDVGDDALDGEDREVADGQQREAGEPEGTEPTAVAEEHAGEPDQRQDAHQDLRGLPDQQLRGDEVRDVGGRVIDLDADEDGAGGCGAKAGGRGEAAGGEVHAENLRIDVVSAHHHVM
jgi:hypothetical protein